MSRSLSDYDPLVSLIERDGSEFWFENRDTGIPGDNGPVVVEQLNQHVRLEWVSLPERSWFRVMAKDHRKTIGVPMTEVHRIISGDRSPLRTLRGSIARRGLDEGWTRVGANSVNELEAVHHRFDSLAGFRSAARLDALALSGALTSLFHDNPMDDEEGEC